MLKELITSIVNCEKALEHIRNELNHDTLFSIKPVMRRFDQRNQGFIDTEDFMAFCGDNDIACNSREAYYALKYLDANKDGKVTFDDLAKSLLPKANRKARIITALREPYNIDKKMYLPEVIESGLAFYIGELLIYIREQQKIKQQLHRDDFNIYEMLHELDVQNKGQVTMRQFAQHFSLSDEDVQCFYQAAQQSSDTALSCIELMDALMNSDYSTELPIEDRIQTSPLKMSPLQHMSSNHGQSRMTDKLHSRSVEGNQDIITTVKQSHDSSRFVDDIAEQLSIPQHSDFNGEQLIEAITHKQIKFTANFFKYILKIIMQLKLVEDTKKKLQSRQDFNVMILFSLFDQQQLGIIGMDDLNRGIKLFSRMNNQYQGLLLKQYGDGYHIKYSEFIKMVHPLASEDNLNKIVNYTNTKINSPKEAFSSTTIDYIKSLFEQLIQTEGMQLQGRQQFDFNELYHFLDATKKGYIGENEIKHFFKLHSAYPTNIEVRRLIARWNGNAYGNGFVNKSTFLCHFTR